MTAVTTEHRNHDFGRSLWDALKAAVSQWLAHKDARAGAAIAHYSIFSIGPLRQHLALCALGRRRVGLVCPRLQVGDRGTIHTVLRPGAWHFSAMLSR
jgi:hypothetical protein